MKYTRVFGTAVELMAVASLLQIPVFTLIPHVNTYNSLCVDRLAFPSQNPAPEQLSRLNHIELINVRQCHYDCILSQDGDYPLDEPPLCDDIHHYNFYTFFILNSL